MCLVAKIELQISAKRYSMTVQSQIQLKDVFSALPLEQSHFLLCRTHPFELRQKRGKKKQIVFIQSTQTKAKARKIKLKAPTTSSPLRTHNTHSDILPRLPRPKPERLRAPPMGPPREPQHLDIIEIARHAQLERDDERLQLRAAARRVRVLARGERGGGEGGGGGRGGGGWRR